MSNLVIVAIPDENDRVWKVSSEKIPHLTILFLGDEDKVANLDQIMLFVEHAASTTLRRFYLPVDRRGELGADQADVLFFKKGRYDYKAVRDFRTALLHDNNIKTAYDSTSQFETPENVGAPGQPWIPHLTLGYPATPAKPVPDDMGPSFYSVDFNKIAVWTGGYEGPDFLLKDYGEEFDEMEIPMDVAMSDIQHHGVKGMRWGVRKADVAGALDVSKVARGIGKAAKATGRGIGDTLFETNLEFDSTRNAVNSSIDSMARQAFKRTDLPDIKQRHGDYGKLRNRVKKPFSKEARAYRKDAKETYIKRLEEAANSMTNVSGTRQYTIRERGWELPSEGGALPSSKHFWSVTSREIKHADGDYTWDVEVVVDNEGYITDLKPVETEDSMGQAADLGAAFLAHHGVKGMRSEFDLEDRGAEFILEHYGVKGMRWGVSRNRGTPSAVSPRATSVVPHGARRRTKVKTEGGENHPASNDAIKVAEAKAKLKKSGTAALSNKELQDLQTRLNLERNVSQLVSTTGAVGRGRKFVKGLTGTNKEFNETLGTGIQTARLVKQIR